MSEKDNWNAYKVFWTVREHHVFVGDYEGSAVYQNFLLAPDAKTARKMMMKSDLVYAVKRVQKMKT